MDTTTLLSRLLSAARTVMPVAPVTAVEPTLSQLELGQSLRAQVVARLADGSYRVLIGNTPLNLTLPAQVQSGEVLNLRLVAQTPRPQFELLGASESTNPQVSSAGRLVGQLVSASPAAPTRQAQPLVAAPSSNASDWLEPLARAVERSGVFYESHQARWVRGNYPLERLREEPQAAIGRAEHRAAAESAAHGPERTSQPPETASVLPAAAQGDLDAPQPGAKGPVASTTAVKDEPASSIVARETLPIVRQQLETLESRHFLWQGEAWPGQAMQWEIAEQERDPHSPQEGRDWATRLDLSLPALGDISAVIGLSARGIDITLGARDAESARSMRAASAELIHALEAAGLGRVVLQVRTHELAG